MKQLIISCLILSLLPLTACGKPEPEEPPSSQELIVDYAETFAALQLLLFEHEELKKECARLQEREGEYLTAIKPSKMLTLPWEFNTES